MAAHRHQASYNGIIFNRAYGGTDPDDPASLTAAYLDSDYRLSELDDTLLSVSDMNELRQFMEGAEPNESFEGVRLLRVSGRILGVNVADLEDKAWTLRNALSPATVRRLSTQALVGSFPDAPAGVLPFDFKRDTTTPGTTLALRYYGRPAIGRPLVIGRQREGLARTLAFQLICFDPRCYAQALTQTTLADLAGGSNTVTNAGNAIVYPQIRVVMSADGASTVTLTNTTTGQAFVMNLVSAFGAYPANLWLMTERGEMIDESRVSKYSLRKTGGGFLVNQFLVPGANTITWTPATGITSVRFDFRAAYS